jgi:DNA-binding CsgD family transcriptional regulator
VCTNPAAALRCGSFSCWNRYEPALLGALVLDRDDPCPPQELAHSRVPVGIVGVEGNPRHRQVRELLAAHGASGELRLIIRDHRGVWGFLGLLRSSGGRGFDREDMTRLARLGPALVAAIRSFVRMVGLSPAAPAAPPGVIMVGADHVVKGISPQARVWLDQLWDPGCEGWLHTPFAAEISMHVRNDPAAKAPLICASATGLGRWIAVHGQLLDGHSGDVAIILQAASGDLLLPSFCHWYDISQREGRVLEQLRVGEAPKHIARRLHVSVHTVNTHLRAIYRKTGAAGRDHLTAALAG